MRLKMKKSRVLLTIALAGIGVLSAATLAFAAPAITTDTPTPANHVADGRGATACTACHTVTAPVPVPTPEPTVTPTPDPTVTPTPDPTVTPTPDPTVTPTPDPTVTPTPDPTTTPVPTTTVDASGTVRIHVMGRTGHGVKGASVTLVNVATGGSITATAGKHGIVTFRNVPYGKYTATVTLANGHVLKRTFTVKHRRTTFSLKDHHKKGHMKGNCTHDKDSHKAIQHKSRKSPAKVTRAHVERRAHAQKH